MIGIYKITNNINNKVYIGQSVNISARWKAHRNIPFNPNNEEYEKPLYRAIRKYGLENFTFTVLEECLPEELDDKEIYWISKFDSTDIKNGYNLTKGGQSAQTSSKLTQEEVDQIKFLIKNTEQSYGEIGKIFNISERAIRMINEGETWVVVGESYPLRQHKIYKKNYCPFCGKEIMMSSKTCVFCVGKAQGKGCPISREELKSLIRTMPFLKIGVKYGVSDNAVRGWCKRLSLPYQKKVIKSYSEEEWEKV